MLVQYIPLTHNRQTAYTCCLQVCLSMSSTKQSSTASADRNGNPKNLVNHLPISELLSLYCALKPNFCIRLHQFCPKWNLQQSIVVCGNVACTALCIYFSKSMWIVRGCNSYPFSEQLFAWMTTCSDNTLQILKAKVQIPKVHNFYSYIREYYRADRSTSDSI